MKLINRSKRFWLTLFCGFFILSIHAQEVRKEISLDKGWKTIASGVMPLEEEGFESANFNDENWLQVDVPHNWDQYEGFRRMKHGNRHGAAWYRKTFQVNPADKGKQHFLFFEGVGSFATVWVNGQKVGEHAGGRTTFTLDITDAIKFGKENTLAVKADHPAWIADLPWVCGGCSGEWGFSEGSQPMGIFRPVTLVVTDPVRVEPFGVHIWNDPAISKASAKLHLTTELSNYGSKSKEIKLVNRLLDAEGKEVDRQESRLILEAGQKDTVRQETKSIRYPNLWSPASPYLYTMVTEVYEGDKIIDRLETPYGIRWVSWPVARKDGDHRFFINGEPLFINGICEYEHLMGQSHAFTDQQVESRVEQMLAAGFNAFRDAHQPHNFRYHEASDREGILFWTQFSAHIWYDTPAFKKNFKQLLRDWVKERRNSPSVVLWGLQNESTIPKAFAQECTNIIREMDPTTSSQRLVTTCNGGEGTDWNVIQNWSGTYGGDPQQYGEELSEQILNGEYGAWRTLDLHTEGPFDQKGAYSEDRFYQLMQIKVREAEEHKDSLAGQFHWLFNSHENPGRIQNGEAFRDIDQVGPVNYKGLVTPWEEPTDTYYMYRSEYADKETDPMVYIVSHTWPDRWTKPGMKDSLVVFSNCEEVELFNAVNGHSLGKRENPGLGKNFQWDQANIQYNVLKAVGYINGKAEDLIVLHHLPKAPDFDQLMEGTEVLKSQAGYTYLYRVNAGGPDYTDQFGQLWQADVQRKDDQSWGSLSWTDQFENLPAFYASQRRTHDPIKGTKDWDLFQTFRYGKQQLRYEFPLPDGEYLVELYFNEPWYGTGGGMDCSGWRDFDVAISGDTVLHHVDIWKEVGHDHALKKVVKGKAKDGVLTIYFPKTTSGQALISGIAISSKGHDIKASPASSKTIKDFTCNINEASVQSWLDTGQPQYSDEKVAFSQLPYQLYGADWIRFPSQAKKVLGSFRALSASHVYVLMDSRVEDLPAWLDGFEGLEQNAANAGGVSFHVYKKALKAGENFIFGENGKASTETLSMYSLVLVEDYEMGEGEEQRPVEVHEAEKGSVAGAIRKGNFKKSDYVSFEDDAANAFSWESNPGLAGTFLIRFRYMNNTNHPLKIRLQIIADNGVVMRDDMIDFPVADEKWKILNTTSGSMLNAGKYIIRISGDGMKGLWLDRVEFQ